MVHGAIIAGAVAGVAAAVTFEVTVFAPWRGRNWPDGVAEGLRAEWASIKAEFRDVVGGTDPHVAHAQQMEARARRRNEERRQRQETQEEEEARDLRELREEIEAFEMHERQSAIVRRRMRQEFEQGFASGAQRQPPQQGVRRRTGAQTHQQDEAPALPPKPSSPSSPRAVSSPQAPRSPTHSHRSCSRSKPLIDLSSDSAVAAAAPPALSSSPPAAHPDSGPPTPRSGASSSPRAPALPFHASLSSHDAMLAPASEQRSSGSVRSHDDDGASDFAIVSPPPSSVGWSDAASNDGGVSVGAVPLSRGPSSIGTPFDDADPFDEVISASHGSISDSGMFHSAERDESAWRMPGASNRTASSAGARSETVLSLSDEEEWERLSHASSAAASPRAHMRALTREGEAESRL